jgi:hypothetical protein
MFVQDVLRSGLLQNGSCAVQDESAGNGSLSNCNLRQFAEDAMCFIMFFSGRK